MTFEPKTADWHQPYLDQDPNAWHMATEVGMTDVTREHRERWRWSVSYWNDRPDEAGVEVTLANAMTQAENRLKES